MNNEDQMWVSSNFPKNRRMEAKPTKTNVYHMKPLLQRQKLKFRELGLYLKLSVKFS